ncbi:MAG: TonB family protein [Gammaproteobacteria bacterium]|nr:TonB family protein [Gammaproteobacteria bacterium]
MKKITITLIGFLVTLSLMFLMTELIAKPKPSATKPPIKADVPPQVIPEEKPPEPNQPTPNPPMPSIEPSMELDSEIVVDPIEMTDFISQDFTPKNSEVMDTIGLPAYEGLPMSEVDSQAIPLMQTPPSYPLDALQKGIEGWVKLKFDVDNQGMAENIRVVATSHRSIFNQEAKRALKKWRFKPGKQNGLAVGLQNQVVTMEFNLEQDN